MGKISSYLTKLQWDPRLNHGWVPAILTNLRVTLLLITTIIVGGVFSLANLPRRINPEVNIPIVFITTVFPGAGPEDVETLVTDPLEIAIRGVPGIERYSSSSSENVSSIVIEFDSKSDPDKAKADVQSAVDGVTDLPETTTDPKVIRLDFEDVPVLTFAVTTEADPLALFGFTRKLKEELEALPQIESVILTGFETNEVQVALNPDALLTYGVNPLMLGPTIQTALTNIPAGTVRATTADVALGTQAPDDVMGVIRSLPVITPNGSYQLSDLADISLKATPNQPESYIGSPEIKAQRAVTFSVFKTAGTDLEESAIEAKTVVDNFAAQDDDQFKIRPITDFNEQIQEQFGDLIIDFSTSILLVFLTLLIFLGIRQASIASFVIPLSFFATFAAMYVFDIELSFLSLFSLLLGLGMIVDDTIVMISAMTDYYATGKFTPSQTGLLVWKDYIAPTLSSNLTNIWSFIPLLIAGGIIGEFTKVISIVVTLALINSTIIALIITIPLMIAILKPPRVTEILRVLMISLISLPLIILFWTFRQNQLLAAIIIFYGVFVLIVKLVGRQVYNWSLKQKRRVRSHKRWLKWLPKINWRDGVQTGFIDSKRPIATYKRFLDRVLISPRLKKQTLIAVISLSVFSYLLVPLGFVKNEFFPKTDQNQLYISVTLPAGTPLAVTQAEGLRLLEEIRQTPDSEYVLLDIGAGAQMSTVTSGQIETNKILLSMRLKDNRERTSMAVAATLREQYTNYDQGDLQVVEQSGGPPSGADLSFTILGEELDALEAQAALAVTYLKDQAGVTNVDLSVKPGTSKLTFVPDQKTLAEAGLTAAQVGLTLRTLTSGLELSKVEIDSPECVEECPVQLRMTDSYINAETIPSVLITTNKGEEIPLTQLGTLSLQPSPTRIDHLDGDRAMTVTGAVIPGYNQVEIAQRTLQYLENEAALPEGYRWQTGGANEENEKSVISILQAMVIAAILIMATMIIELRSFKKALIVMFAIPLAISGVFIMFALTNTPLSFPALIGILALFGIVVKNSIMIIDKINLNLAIKLPFNEAVSDGASSRLEPIAFSSLTNIIGLLPITLSDPLWRGLGGAIISGLTLSGLIMLVFIPVIFDLWYRKRYTKN